MAVPEDLLEQGFQLAYFICSSRPAAIRVLTGALNKLKAQHGRENRRAYWRDKYLKRGISRIARQEGDALQWLILFESDRFEREQESSDEPSLEAMAIRYVKSLVRMTTAMSSFYVNVGLNRLLHNYSTAEVQLAYEALTERYLGADEYRRAKAVLMDKLECRFGRYLKTCRTQHGELRFEVWQDQARWADLVASCLTLFIPWSTSQTCPASRDSGANEAARRGLPMPSQDGSDPDEMEIKRCHTFIDPVCYGRLAHVLAIDPPDKKLALPRFFMENAKPETRSDQPPPARLTAEERRAIGDHLSTEAARRRRASAHILKVMVDGVERFRLEQAESHHGAFQVGEGSELIEIFGEHEGEGVVLATHRLRHAPGAGIEAYTTTFFLHNGQRLKLSISPVAPDAEGQRRSVVNLDLHPNPVAVWFSRPAWKPALQFAFVAVVFLAVGWFLGFRRTKFDRQQVESAMLELEKKILKQPHVHSLEGFAPVSTSTPQTTALAHPPDLVATYTLTPDDLIVRGTGGSDVPSVVVPSHPALIELELPIARGEMHKTFRVDIKPFMSKGEILRENLLRAQATPAGVFVRVWIPTTVLDANQDYSVDLRAWSSGKLEEVSTYTFRSVAKR